jgi:hypothetical protein
MQSRRRQQEGGLTGGRLPAEAAIARALALLASYCLIQNMFEFATVGVGNPV